MLKGLNFGIGHCLGLIVGQYGTRMTWYAPGHTKAANNNKKKRKDIAPVHFGVSWHLGYTEKMQDRSGYTGMEWDKVECPS